MTGFGRKNMDHTGAQPPGAHERVSNQATCRSLGEEGGRAQSGPGRATRTQKTNK